MAEKPDKKTQLKSGGGLRIGVMNNVMVAIALAVSVWLLYATHQSITGYNSLQRTTQRYISCQQDAVVFQDSSDYLTDEARCFVITGEAEHARNYIEEVEVNQHRENAIAEIKSFLEGTDSYTFLARSLEYSNALIDVECYAMRLICDVNAYDPEAMPRRVMNTALKPEDAALSAEEKRALAVELLFGDAYREQKALIHEGVEKSVSALVSSTLEEQLTSADRVRGLLHRQRLLIALLLVLLFVVVLGNWALVIKPLRRSVEHIHEQRRIPESGSREMRFLARTYNEMFDRQARSTEELTYSATHDSLTGVLNRTAYDAMFPGFDVNSIGLLIIDIDKFKDFNDIYGHDVGDQVLQRVAQVIRDSFRSEDYVFRIGGDEFCVIMVHAGMQLTELVKGKIACANQLLQNPQDGLPKASLSVGVAFGDRPNPIGDIFKDADTALYSVKRTIRCSCAVYGDPQAAR